ncbi:MAG: RecX family transcriptional regulator [Pseudomonadota bacterium]
MVKALEAKQKAVRPVTAERLLRAAMHYLGRFESNRKRLEEVLERKVQRWSGHRDVAAFAPLIGETVERCVALDLVDDARFARMRAQALLRRGKAPRLVAQDLTARGIARPLVSDVLAEFEIKDEKAALAVLARRRRLGLYRGERQAQKQALDPRKWRDKEIAAMVRGGHSFSMAAEFLALESEAALEEWLSDT